jgi:hypothetical protein
MFKKGLALMLGMLVAIPLWAALESSTYISGLVSANPTGSDNYSTADDHIRLIKSTLLNTFPSITGAVTATHTELNKIDGFTGDAGDLNILDGVTATTAELNILDGVTSTAAELNVLDGILASTAELNLLDGVTSTTAELNIVDGVTATAAEINIVDGLLPTQTELNYVDGVTSAIQTQINTTNTNVSTLTTNGGVNITGKTGTTKTLSTSAASGGSDGDIWYRY